MLIILRVKYLFSRASRAMAACVKKRRPLVHALSALTLVLLASACSSSEKSDPMQNPELANFRLSDVWSETSSQKSVVPTTKTLRLVTIFTKVKGIALNEPVQEGITFNVFQGSKLIASPVTNSDGVIKWEVQREFESESVQDYELYSFRIVGTAPYSGYQKRTLRINYEKTGSEAVIDITDGQRSAPAPVIAPPSRAATKDDADTEETYVYKPEFFPLETDFISAESKSMAVSMASGKPYHWNFMLQTCLRQKSSEYKPVTEGLDFTVKLRRSGVDEPHGEQEVVSLPGGCLPYDLEIKDFDYFAIQRWYPIESTICSKNSVHGDYCFSYTFYFNPWHHFSGLGNQDYIYRQGLTARTPFTKRQTRPEAHTIDDTKDFLLMAPLRETKLVAKGYAATFNGRTYRVNKDLNMSSIRHYQITVEPKVQRWTFDNPKQVEALENGYVTMKFLLRKSHGDSTNEYPLSDKSEEIRRAEEECFPSKSVFDLPLNKELRHWCYTRSYMDHFIRSVKVEQGTISQVVDFEFDDIRYVTSRNTLMMELSTDVKNAPDHEQSIVSPTYISTFSSLMESSFRDWQKNSDLSFVDREGNRSRMNENDIFDVMAQYQTKSLVDAGVESNSSLAQFIDSLPPMRVSTLDNHEYRTREETVFEDLTEIKTAAGAAPAADNYHFETIDEILEITDYGKDVSRMGSNFDLLREAAEKSQASSGLPLPVSIYRLKNALEARTTENADSFPFTEEDRQVIFRAKGAKFRPDSEKDQGETYLNLYDEPVPGSEAAYRINNYDLLEVLSKACRALYPTINSTLADQEAHDFARNAYVQATKEYESRKQILCKMQNVLNNRSAFEGREIDPTEEVDGDCRSARPVCVNYADPLDEEKDLSFGARMFYKFSKYVVGPEKAERPANASCGELLDESEEQELFAILKGEESALDKVRDGTMTGVLALLRPLAMQWISAAPFDKIRNEVLQREKPELHLGTMLVSPDDEPERYIPRTLQERCEADPLGYLEIDFTEHVTALKGDDKERLPKIVDVTNLQIAASITISKWDMENEMHASNRSTIQNSSVDVNASNAGYLWYGFTVSGSGFQGMSSAGTTFRESKQAQRQWYVQNARIRSNNESAQGSSTTSKMINAEYATFDLEVQTMNCVSLRPSFGLPPNYQGQLTNSGYLLCEDALDPERDPYRTIEETWFYTYLYFRNNYSPMTDTASSLVERPWTVTMRGNQLFDVFRDTLAGKSIELELESTVMPNHSKSLEDAYRDFRDHRSGHFLNSPGLLRRTRVIKQPFMKYLEL